MGKRLVRVFNPDIVKKADQFKGREMDVVLINKTTFHGWFEEVKDHHLILKDNRGYLHNIPVSTIEEIIYDLVAAY